MDFFINVIPHGDYAGLPPTGVFIFWIVASLVSLIGYGLYNTFGPNSKDLKDQIKEHAKMHEMGIAHGHEGRDSRPVLTQRAQEQDYPQHRHGNKKD
jgi:hypothetical protein|tara:strand:- start:894 stop:1184 length:291 start_codon:yes stop_codon:yes gene_type:complete